jgi:hypothetical protein
MNGNSPNPIGLKNSSEEDPFCILSLYERQNLLFHCAEAGRDNIVHKILSMTTPNGANAWFTLHFQGGTLADYVRDVSLGFLLCDKKTLNGTRLAKMATYTLAASSISTISKNIPPRLLCALICSNLWTIDQTIAYARSIFNPYVRPVALAAVVKYLPKNHAT